MKLRAILSAVAVLGMAHPAFADIDCDDPANAEEEVCLALPQDGVTNLVPLIAPIASILGVSALAATGAGGGSTTSTPSTTN